MTRQRFTQFAWFTLGFNLLVILWGAFVRATGSGAGCGNHWPLCQGEVVPRAPAADTLIELTHRLTSGVALLLGVALLVLALRRFEPGHRVRKAAWWSMAFLVGEAAVGAALVLAELVGQNESLLRAWVMALHLVNTFLLIGALALVAYWSGAGSSARPGLDPARRRTLTRLAAAALAGSMLLGASGAVAALGDTLYPPGDLGSELRSDFTLGGPVLKQLRVLHPLIAVAVSVVLLQLASRTRRRSMPQVVRRSANALNLLVVAQLTVGVLNIMMRAPVWIQLVHLLLADLLWIALVLTCAGALGRQPVSAPVDEPSTTGTAAIAAS